MPARRKSEPDKTAKKGNLKKPRAQRQFRDRLFRFIFGNPEHKEWTLWLYNAVNGTHYTDTNDIDLQTIQDVIYVGMKNDVSFIIDSQFVFIEQQSTLCPNMPTRFFIYMGMAYQQIVQESNHRIYSQNLFALPTPKCICFYNGAVRTEDTRVLKLSDAFKAGALQANPHLKQEELPVPDLEVRVTMININYGHSRKLLNACKPLKEYSWFCDKVRQYQTEGNLLNQHGKSLGEVGEITEKDKWSFEEAVDKALSEMPKDFIIRKYLIGNKAEVKNMCLTEFNEAEIFQALADDYRIEGIAEGEARGIVKGRAEGRAEGKAEGMVGAMAGLVDDGILTVKQAAQRVNMTVPAFKKMAAELKKQKVDA